MGIYAAFIASLFIEMYGIPLTVYLSSTALSPINPTPPNYLLNFSLLGQNFGMDLWMLVGAGITLIGMLIIALGWYTIYNREGFVRSGIYSHSRHPQYLGIILIAAGWFIGWPTLLTTALFPALVYTYYKLSLKEEKEVAEEVGKEKYEKYREKTRMFI
ncbi:MAG: DUF1295 domain-containing protein [Candidatus Nanohaloarchaeota archaeon QJJ-9]|nr:DUF1295 domain-containing protein [Candidatus Nanohaloarchaeota archaeon QJJ-9]